MRITSEQFVEGSVVVEAASDLMRAQVLDPTFLDDYDATQTVFVVTEGRSKVVVWHNALGQVQGMQLTGNIELSAD